MRVSLTIIPSIGVCLFYPPALYLGRLLCRKMLSPPLKVDDYVT